MSDTKAHICVFTVPHYGHTYCILPLLKILSETYHVTVFSLEKFRPLIESQGCVFTSYNLGQESFAFDSDHVDVIDQMIELTKRLLPTLIENNHVRNADAYVCDAFALWGKIIQKKTGKNYSNTMQQHW